MVVVVVVVVVIIMVTMTRMTGNTITSTMMNTPTPQPQSNIATPTTHHCTHSMQISTSRSIFKNCDDMRIETTLEVSSLGGEAGS
jgi:hypothetical protein